jgi:hypothetical protein
MSLQAEAIDRLTAVEAELNYLKPMSERPRNYTYDPPPGVARSNLVPDPRTLPIHDARPIARSVSLDEEGFGLIRRPRRY